MVISEKKAAILWWHFLLAVLGSWLYPPPALGKELHFQRFSIRDGLAHDSVYGLLQDRHGFIWLATERGLCRFDGYQFLTYTHAPFDQQSLSSNSTGRILEDENGYLWVGTWGGGLNLFDTKRESFSHFRFQPNQPNSLSSDRIQTLAFDAAGSLWVGTYDGGLSRFQPNTQDFENFRHDEHNQESLPDNRVWAIQILDNKHLLIGTDNGLAVLETQTGQFHRFRHNQNHPFTLASNRVRDILKLRNGNLLVGTAVGVQLFFPKTGVFKEFLLGPESGKSTSTRTLYEDHSGKIWVGTIGNGLYRIDPQTNEMDHFLNMPHDIESLANNTVEVIFEDHAKVLWVATLGGVCKTDLKPPKFEQHRHIKGDPSTITHDEISAIYADSLGDLWIGTFGSGLNRLGKDTDTVQVYGPNTDPAIPAHTILSMLEDPPGTMWLGTQEFGLVRFDPKTGRTKIFRHDAHNPNSISSNRVRYTISGPKNALWLATDKGLNRFNPSSEAFESAQNNPRFSNLLGDSIYYALFFDRSKRLWAGGERGLRVLNSKLNDFWQPQSEDPKYRDLFTYPVYCLLEDYRGQIWLGTNAGLYSIHPESGKVHTYMQKDGLPSNTILSILEDQNGMFWIATDQGLSRMEPNTPHFRNFDFFDGLLGNAFNRNAAFLAKDGKLFFGGRRGYNSFYPNKVVDNPYVPPIVLTNVKMFNQSVLQGGPALDLDVFSLEYSQKMVTFEFAALDYTVPEKNRFRYQLKGFNDHWVDAGARPTASYTNLNPGKYLLWVRGSNNDGLWNELGFQLQINVIPPWWRRIWAYFAFACLALLLLVVTPLLRIRYLKAKSKALADQITVQTDAMRERNQQLEEKNDQLLRLDQIVATINQEWQMDRLVDILLEQGLKLFPNAQYGSFLKFDHQEQAFRFISATDNRHLGLMDLRLKREIALTRYTAGREKLEDGVYLVNQFADLPRGHTLSNYQKPVVLMVMTLEHKSRIDAILLLENYDYPDAFRNSDMEKLKRFRDHATSAIAKANLMNELSLKAQHLYDTQQLLLENAHQAGMAEIASNVLHSVGNALNSINTSADIIIGIGQESPMPLFEKVATLLEAHRHELTTYLNHDSTGKKVPSALLEITRSLSKTHRNILQELDVLKNHVTTLRQVVSAQQEYANMDGGVFECQISTCIEEALQIEQTLLEEKKIRIVKEYCDLPAIKLQKSKLLRILVHLINHAADAMTDQSSRILFLRTSIANGLVKVEIRDTGTGLSPQETQTLFHQNFAGPSNHLGLGLHYCATAVGEMGGELTVTSNGVGQGTLFTLSLPLAGSMPLNSKI